MNKRSALMLSAALVLTLIVGGLAVATGVTGPTVSNAVPRAERRSSPEPIVRTVRRTVTRMNSLTTLMPESWTSGPSSAARRRRPGGASRFQRCGGG